MDPDDLREPVFLATGQPCGELAVAQVAFFILHSRGVLTVFGLFSSRHAVACRGLTGLILVTTLKAPAFEGRGYSIVVITIVYNYRFYTILGTKWDNLKFNFNFVTQ